MTSSDNEQPRVLDPAVTTVSTTQSLSQAPIFVSNNTNWVKYLHSVSKCTTVPLVMAISDRKAQARLRIIGLMLYLAADDYTQDTIKQAETEENICTGWSRWR